MIGNSRFKDAYFQLLHDLFHFWVKPGTPAEVVFFKPGFVLDEALTSAGMIIEVGGPTGVGDYGVCNILDYRRRGKRVIITNIERYPENPNKEYDVELIADGRKLPFGNSSLGAVFASCLPFAVHAEVLPEAARVLKAGGVLVWRGVKEADVTTAGQNGLEPVMYLWDTNKKERRELMRLYPEVLRATFREAERCMYEVRKASLGLVGNFLLTRANSVFSGHEQGSIQISPPIGELPYTVVFQKT